MLYKLQQSDKEQMQPDKRPNQDPTTHDYYYFKDHEGRIQRFRRPKYQPRPGYLRLKFLQKPYIKFIRSSYDSKLTWLPWLAGLSVSYFIYQFTMYFSQNQLNRQIKAKLPFEYKNQQVTEVYRLLKQHERDQKARKEGIPRKGNLQG